MYYIFKCNLPTASVLDLLEIFVNEINVSSAFILPTGLLCTSNEPAFARSFDVPLCKAVSSHLASDGFSIVHKKYD